MVIHATASSTADPTMNENFSGLFESIFGIFDDLAEIGSEWGEPWGWLLPTFVAIAVALAFVGGTRYIFQKAQERIRPVFFFALLVVGLLAFGAIWTSNEQQAVSSEVPDAGG